MCTQYFFSTYFHRNTDSSFFNITFHTNWQTSLPSCSLENKILSEICLKISTPSLTIQLRLIHEELNQKLDDAVVQSHHLSVLHALVQSQALCAPQEVFPGVVGVSLHRERNCVQLVAEEGEEVAVCDHGLGHEGSGDILVVPETYGGEREASTRATPSLRFKAKCRHCSNPIFLYQRYSCSIMSNATDQSLC